jgi:polyhydroxyalkanoate synthesis regulator protein
VLTQIIVEEEAKGQTMLPVNFLRQLISFYGDNLQALVPGYLEKSMAIFAHNQQQIRQSMEKALGMFPFAQQFEEMGKQNMAFLQNAMQMFSPFRADADRAPQAEPERGSSDLDQMRAQLAEMQRRLDELQRKS